MRERRRTDGVDLQGWRSPASQIPPTKPFRHRAVQTIAGLVPAAVCDKAILLAGSADLQSRPREWSRMAR
jgi:hypothetical protein